MKCSEAARAWDLAAAYAAMGEVKGVVTSGRGTVECAGGDD